MQATRHSKKASRSGWHKAYIVAAVQAGGTTLRKLSVANGYAPCTLANTLHTPWPKGERIIAAFIGEKPQDIWPDRYDEDGRPYSGHGQRKSRGQGKYCQLSVNNNTDKTQCNVEMGEAI